MQTNAFCMFTFFTRYELLFIYLLLLLIYIKYHLSTVYVKRNYILTVINTHLIFINTLLPLIIIIFYFFSIFLFLNSSTAITIRAHCMKNNKERHKKKEFIDFYYYFFFLYLFIIGSYVNVKRT